MAVRNRLCLKGEHLSLKNAMFFLYLRMKLGLTDGVTLTVIEHLFISMSVSDKYNIKPSTNSNYSNLTRFEKKLLLRHRLKPLAITSATYRLAILKLGSHILCLCLFASERPLRVLPNAKLPMHHGSYLTD